MLFANSFCIACFKSTETLSSLILFSKEVSSLGNSSSCKSSSGKSSIGYSSFGSSIFSFFK